LKRKTLELLGRFWGLRLLDDMSWSVYMCLRYLCQKNSWKFRYKKNSNMCSYLLRLTTSWVGNNLLRRWRNIVIWSIFHMITLLVLLCILWSVCTLI